MPPSAPEKIPQHVAIIMDGNGRWAQARGLPRLEGHRRGVETVRTIVDAARELGIRYLTLYAFSAENWKRPAEEVSGLMGLLDYFLKRELDNLLKHKVRLLTIGRIDALPLNVQRELNRVVAATKDFTEWHLVLALNYGARTELADAAKHYDDCYHDYLFAWCNRDNLALHYGYWDNDQVYDQHQALLGVSDDIGHCDVLLCRCCYDCPRISVVHQSSC